MPEFFKSDIFIQAIGILGLIVSIISFQFKGYKQVLFMRIASETIFGIQYIFLGAYTGMAANFAACLSNTVYYVCFKRDKSTLVFRILFSVMFTALGILTWAGPLSLLIIVAKILSTFANGLGKASTIRYFNIAVMAIWIIYDACYGSIGGTISDVITLISIIAAIIHYAIVNKKASSDKSPE